MRTSPSSPSSPAFTVGFDLDMTLIDSRPGIKAVYEALVAENGGYVDTDLVTSRLGPPVEAELANWYPADRVPALGERYRALYPDHGIAPTTALPGAAAALEAVRAAGGRALVVTAKSRPLAKLHIDHLGLAPDAVVGGLWADAKAEALTEYGAAAYVGDHVGDVAGARAARVLSVAVATGPCPAEELRAAGADVVLPDLTAFPRWLAGFRAGAPGAPGA